MDISPIYKKDKLYNVTSTLSRDANNDAILPLDFNGVAVLYEYPAGEKLPVEQDAFLNKVIQGGMKLDPAQTLKANLSHGNTSLQKLSEQLGAKKVVIFGSDWIDGLRNGHFEKNLICSLFGMKVLATDTLDVISANDNAKKIFWVSLKKMF